MSFNKFRIILAVLLVLATSLGAQQVIFETNNRLGPGDMTGARGGYEDVYRVRVTGGRVIEVIVPSTDFDSYVRAVLPGNFEVENDDFDGLNAGFVTVVPNTGTMELAVSAVYGDGEGAYTVRVTEMPDPREISVGQLIRDVIGGTGGAAKLVPGAGEVRRAHYYRLRGRRGDRVIIEMRSSDFDSFLEISDVSGFRNTNDDGGGGLNSRLAYDFTVDGYALITARGVGDNVTGAYELQVSAAATRVAHQYDGFLGPGDQRAYDGKFFDTFEYQGRAGQSVSMRLDSDTFDALLYLNRADGSVLAYDDDSGGNNNSLLDAALPATETYRIFVTAYGEGQGPYRLTIFE